MWRRVAARALREQGGAVTVFVAAAMMALLLFAGMALDFGRAHLLRAQLQTAVDAASLAGALQVVPMAELSITRWETYEDWCQDPVTQKPYRCMETRQAPNVTVSGTQWDLLHQNLWRQAAGGACLWPYNCTTYRLAREWLVLPSDTDDVATAAFYQNARWQGGSSGAQVDGLTIGTDPLKAEVTATATLTTNTHFLKLVGIRELRLTRTGSAVPVRR